MIWFDRNSAVHSFQSTCANAEVCIKNVNKTYNLMKEFKHEQLHTELRELLYQAPLNVHNLVCSNNQGRQVACPNGFCQFSRKDRFTVDRKCVPQGDTQNPSGILIGTIEVEEPDADTSFTYACNRPMCNGDSTYTAVQDLLIEYKLLSKSHTTDPSEVETTTKQSSNPNTKYTTTKSRENAAITIFHQPMMYFQWMVILIIKTIFKK